MKLIGSRVFPLKMLGKLPMPIQHIIAEGLIRVQDPEPEGPVTSGPSNQQIVGWKKLSWGWLPILSLIIVLGILSVAYANTAARDSAKDTQIFFWLGLLLIFVPATVRLISPKATRFERICLLCVVGISFYLVNLLRSPLSFYVVDEFLHLRTLDDIARSGHLFSENSLLPVSPYYPGLEIVTNALSTLSGLNSFYAGIVVTGVARLVMIVSLFMLYELITKSPRIAGIAMMIYMADPHFLFSDAAFAYRSLALPLATFALFVTAYITTYFETPSISTQSRWIMFAAWIALGAAVVTHHTTVFFFDVLLILWVVMYAFQHHASLNKWSLSATALFAVFATVAWIGLPGNPVVSYLTSYAGSAVIELWHILTGTGAARHLFVDYAANKEPLWEQMTALASVALISLCLPFGLLCLALRYRSNALLCAFGLASLLYPLSHFFRLTSGGSEISDRLSADLFLPMACVLAIFITQFWPTRLLNWKHTLLITWAITVVFLGGTILGAGPPPELLAGPYLVSAGPRSIELEGIQAALWANSNIGPNNRMATDLTN